MRLFTWLRGLFPSQRWQKGYCFIINSDGKHIEMARRNRLTGAVQFVLWKKGEMQCEHTYEADYWHDYDSSWWPNFSVIAPPSDIKEQIARVCNLFPEVKWDRWAGDEHDRCVFYGWIARRDGQRDFLTLMFDRGELDVYWTSSAKHSKSFSVRLGMDVKDHLDCKRIENDFATIPNVIKS